MASLRPAQVIHPLLSQETNQNTSKKKKKYKCFQQTVKTQEIKIELWLQTYWDAVTEFLS